MSASREKKLRQDPTPGADPKTFKELEQAKAEKRSNLLYSVIGVLFLVAVVAFREGRTAVTIDGEKYTAAEVSFYYKNVYRSFLQNNSYFISYLGLDTGSSLKGQTVNATAASMLGVEEGSSWHDYMMDNTIKQMTMIQNGLKEAEAKGFQYPAGVKTQYDDTMQALKDTAVGSGTTVKKYLQQNLGSTMTEKVYGQELSPPPTPTATRCSPPTRRLPPQRKPPRRRQTRSWLPIRAVLLWNPLPAAMRRLPTMIRGTPAIMTA